jgi:hypothetical protein
MPMKNFLVILTIFSFLSCSGDRKPNNKEGFLIVNEQLLIGEWGIYAWINGDNAVYCNACPRVKIEDNGTATVTLPGGKHENLNWKLNGKKLTITSIGNKNSEAFNATNYEVSYIKEKGVIRLELKEELNKRNSIMLGRSTTANSGLEKLGGNSSLTVQTFQ